MANPAPKIINFHFSCLILSVRRPFRTCASFFFCVVLFLCQCLSPDFFVSATVHTTLPLTSSFLISLAVPFFCVSCFCFCVLSGAVYVYEFLYYVCLYVSVSVSVWVFVYVYVYVYLYLYMSICYGYMYMYVHLCVSSVSGKMVNAP